MQLETETVPTSVPAQEEVSDRIFTVANFITFLRLCLIPISFALLLQGRDIAAGVLFGLTAATDFLDGYIARKTHTVTRLGQMLDPLVDRLLIISAVIGLLIVGRLPLWIVLVVLLRDIYVLGGGIYLIRKHGIRVPVSYIGKVGMWFLSIGFAGLLLNIPILAGMGWCDFTWLPGFSGEPYCWFIWILYIGLVLSLVVTVVYTVRGARALSAKLARQREVGDGTGR
ncbi:MAG: CDP-alcohol phosphatidyltransferase family protein [Coriobacteriaceae bacterium]|nr:CDP-alcohol phosphatidyltransferase family protein [Coriobacteriaceae bacterium]